MLPVFIGIGLGVLLGSIPFYLPGFPAALKLGLAGGPLGGGADHQPGIGFSIGKLYWFMPPSASLALREIGIVLFLAVVGFKSGAGFVDTLINGDAYGWMLYGMAITLIPPAGGRCVGAPLRQDRLSDPVRLAGRLHDRPSALAFANAVRDQWRQCALIRHCLPAGDVPADLSRHSYWLSSSGRVYGINLTGACFVMLPSLLCNLLIIFSFCHSRNLVLYTSVWLNSLTA